MFHVWRARLLLGIPLLFVVICYFPLNEAVQRAKYHEKWAEIKSIIDEISNHAEVFNDLKDNFDDASVSLIAHFLYVHESDGVFFALYNDDLKIFTDNSGSKVANFDPMQDKNFRGVVEKSYRGEELINQEGEEKVSVYYRWVATGLEQRYLITVGTEENSLKTSLENSVVFVFMFSLFIITVGVLGIALFVIKFEVSEAKKEHFATVEMKIGRSI